jgi:MoaA/NifB/PqqE/SkfB family radical SAM enzyme
MEDLIFEPQAKLLWHGDRVKEWLNTGRARPILVEISPTGYCNAKCSFCFFEDKHSKDKIDTEVMLRTLEDLKTLGVQAINWTGGGEPSIHPDFAQFVKLAHKLGIKQGIFTNSYRELPHQELFEWIRVSYTEYDFEKSIAHINKPHVPFGMRLNHVKEYTDQELIDYCVGTKNFGAKYFQITPALEASWRDQPIIECPDFLKEYEDDNFNVHVNGYKYDNAITPKNYPDCYGYLFCPSIDWMGNITVCLYLTLDPRYILGDLNKESVLDIWKRVVAKVPVIEKCQNCCKNDINNRLLYKVKNISNVDFL